MNKQISKQTNKIVDTQKHKSYSSILNVHMFATLKVDNFQMSSTFEQTDQGSNEFTQYSLKQEDLKLLLWFYKVLLG